MLYYYCLVFILQNIFLSEKATLTGLLFLIICYNKSMQSLEWFKNRIGKRIFRDAYKCCSTCDEIFEKGLIINSQEHAEALYHTQNDFKQDGRIMNYRDIK